MYGLIGEKLGHSFSKEIHESLFGYDYNLIELDKTQLDAFLKKREFCAVNVTIPYKQAVIPYLSYIDPLAEKIGAVNTIVNRGGKLYGYNTDAFGLSENLRVHKVCVKNKKVLILGSGGTSLTAKAVCESLGADEILRTSRSEKDGCVTYEQAKRLMSDAQIIINTTPLGMYPNLGGMGADIDDFLSLEAVADAVYNPLCPLLTVKAKERGITAFGGLYMLVAQAARAGEYFLGEKLGEEKTNSLFKKILKSKENIVLIGMPSCGKTTLGKMLSKEFNREFIDTDEVIVSREKTAISDIFSKLGESGFREIESEVIKEVSKRQGVIISTGGGAVLKNDNVQFLKQNGFLVYIDRPLENLTPTADRPLSLDFEALKKRYTEREPIYNRVCDIKIKNNREISAVVSDIKEAFLK